MEYTTIFVLKNDKGHLILERPREFVGVVLRGLDGEYHRTNLKDLHVGYEKVGEVLPLKGENEDSAYVYINGELIEVNPLSPNFEDLVANDEKYKNAISVLGNIYNKINNNLEVEEEIVLDDDSIELDDDIDDVLDEESNITGLSDEHNDESKLVALGGFEINVDNDEDDNKDLGDSSDLSENVEELPVKKEVVKTTVKKSSTPAKSKAKTTRGRSKTTRKNG